MLKNKDGDHVMINLRRVDKRLFNNCDEFSMDNIKYLNWYGKCIECSVQKGRCWAS
jgi:hypothetical protein